MIYLDNSSTTKRKPLKVIVSTTLSLINSANPTRSSHKIALKSALKVFKARQTIKNFLNTPQKADVVFTYNCTEALNMAIFGSAKNNGNVVITAFEHNSVLRPLYALKKTHNITITVVNPTPQGKISEQDILNAVNKNTYLVIVNQTSNVTGTTITLNNLGHKLNKLGIMLLIDCAQSAGHAKINMQKIGANFLTLAGHKGLFGSQGIGALIINNANLTPLKFGGSGGDSLNENMPAYYPEKLEAGTINTVGITSLENGIKFVLKHQNKINKKIETMSKYIINALKQNPSIKLFSNNLHSGVISFSFLNIDNAEATNILNEKYGICLRHGLHCAPLIHKFLKTEQCGLIRVSLSYFNNMAQAKKLIYAINKISQLKN